MEQPFLNGFIGSIEQQALRVHGIVVLRHGTDIAAKRWREDIPYNQYSVSKSFTATAIGIAIGEGILSLDDKVLDFFGAEAPTAPPDALRALTLRHLLTMSMGQNQPYLMGEARWKLNEKNWVRYILSRPFGRQPGEAFLYSNGCTYLAGVMLQKKAGQSLTDYLMPRLFDPLKIPRPEWETCPMGYNFAASGLLIRTAALAKLGQLYLQKGVWQGKQLVPEAWIREATKKQIDSNFPGDGGFGYGYQFWRGRNNSYRADGKYGQFCIVLPDKDAVVAINSEEENTQAILDSVWSEIWPLL